MAASKKSRKAVPAVVVDRQFLLELANTIYDSKTKKFLRLCNGTLQNGPDPKDASRPMHCGLGELYFAMTGEQPKSRRGHFVNEAAVVDLAVKLSTLESDGHSSPEDRAAGKIKALGLSTKIEDALLSALGDFDDEDFNDPETKFREILDSIPEANDGVEDQECRNGACSYEAYRERARAVAAKLREAAKILPE